MVKGKRSVTVNGIGYPIVLAKVGNNYHRRICVNRPLHLCVDHSDEEDFLNGDLMVDYTPWEEIKDLPPEDEYRPYLSDEAIKFIGTLVVSRNEAIQMITAFYPDTEEIRVDIFTKNLRTMLQYWRHYEPGKTYNESKTFGVKL